MKFFGSVFLVLLFATQLFAINAYLKNKINYEGESATLVIHIQAKKIHLRRLKNIAGLPIVQHGGDSTYKIINGEKIKDIYYEVVFYPKKSMTIPPLEFIVDGKKEVTQAIKLTLEKNPNNLFFMEALINKNNPFQNEVIKYSLRFKYHNSMDLENHQFIKPDFTGFWLENTEKVILNSEDDYITHQTNYYLTPKALGKILIEPGRSEIRKKSTFSSIITTRHIRTFDSNTISLYIKDLPSKTDLLGKFDIKTLVDKTNIKGTDTLNLSIKVKGTGNIGDIEAFSLDLKEATVISKEPRVQKYSNNDSISGLFIQRFSISNAKEDFVIPSFELKFYDLKTRSIKTTKSEPIKVHLNNPIKDLSIKGGTEEIKIKRKEGFKMNIINILLGFLLGVIFVFSIQAILKKQQKPKLFKYKNDRDLLQKLFEYKGLSEGIDLLIIKLERKLYLNQKISIPKKEIKIVLKYITKKEAKK